MSDTYIKTGKVPKGILTLSAQHNEAD
jgi:hypothetical protein